MDDKSLVKSHQQASDFRHNGFHQGYGPSRPVLFGKVTTNPALPWRMRLYRREVSIFRMKHAQVVFQVDITVVQASSRWIDRNGLASTIARSGKAGPECSILAAPNPGCS